MKHLNAIRNNLYINICHSIRMSISIMLNANYTRKYDKYCLFNFDNEFSRYAYSIYLYIFNNRKTVIFDWLPS